MQENEPQKLVEKVAGDIESLLDRKVQALKVGAVMWVEGGPGEWLCTVWAVCLPSVNTWPSWPSVFRLNSLAGLCPPGLWAAMAGTDSFIWRVTWGLGALVRA